MYRRILLRQFWILEFSRYLCDIFQVEICHVSEIGSLLVYQHLDFFFVVSNQEKSRNKVLRLLQEESVIWRTPKDATTFSAERQGLDYEQPIEAETAAKGSGITPQSTSSFEEKSAKQSALLDRPNFGQYPAEQGLSGDKGTTISPESIRK